MGLDYLLQYLQERFVEKKRWTLREAKEALRRYQNYLVLIAKYPEKIFVPTEDIDEVWHAHVLHTERYALDCERLFGKFLHHYPSLQTDPQEEKEQMREAFFQTAALYAREFQEPYSLELNISAFW